MTVSSNEELESNDKIFVVGWIRNNAHDQVLEESIDELIYNYYMQLNVILAPNKLKHILNVSERNNDIYFHLLTIYGFYRSSIKIEIVPEICLLIFQFCHHASYLQNIKNNKLFESWANSMATTDGIILGYSQGTSYFYNESIDPFMVQYEQYLERNMYLTQIFHSASMNYYTLPNHYSSSIGYMSEYEHQYEINYSSFNDLYYDKMLDNEVTNQSIERDELLCSKYEQHTLEIFINSKNLAFTYYRWAAIVFDTIWSLVWCL